MRALANLKREVAHRTIRFRDVIAEVGDRTLDQ